MVSPALRHLRRIQKRRRMLGEGGIPRVIAAHLIERDKLSTVRYRAPVRGPAPAYESDARQRLGMAQRGDLLAFFEDGRLLR
jgi:hypothetical protein